jgi:hypothetical protein
VSGTSQAVALFVIFLGVGALPTTNHQPMKERESIEKAYGKIIERLYVTFYDGLVTGESQEELDKAEEKFREGLAKAKLARDESLKVISGKKEP